MAEDQKFCTKCGAVRKGNVKFCGSCGYQFQVRKTGGEDLKGGVPDAIGRVSDAVERIDTVTGGRTIGTYTQEPLNLKVSPPAQWEVLIGEVPSTTISAKTEEAMKGVLTKPPIPAPRVKVPATPPLSGHVCPSCGSPVTPGKKFCGSCGAPVGTGSPGTRSCPKCRSPLALDAQFCDHCGSPAGGDV